MAERKPTGVLVVLTSCTDPSREAEFNHWYSKVHIPEILATGCYYQATRYENSRAKDGQPKYLALYLTDRDDPVAAFKEMRGKVKDPPPAYVKGYGTLTYLYLGPEDRASQQARARAGLA